MESQRENYYILLELSIEPFEKNEAKIRSAIDNKKKAWSFTGSTNLTKLADIERVMLDSNLREKEIKRLISAKEERKKVLLNNLLLIGTDLDSRAIKKMARENKSYGISEKDIRILIDSVKKKNEDRKNIKIEFISVDDANTIDNHLKKINKKDLYQVLDVQKDISAKEMLRRAQMESTRLLEKGQKDTALDPIYQSLYGIILRLFKSEEDKKKYDNYLKLNLKGSQKLVNFYEMIDGVANANEKSIPSSKKIILLEQGVQTGIENVAQKITLYCSFKGYEEKLDVVVCEACGTENKAGASICSQCKKLLFITCANCGKKNGNTREKCISCGFTFSVAEEVSKLLNDARSALSHNDIQGAENLLTKSKALWAKHPDIAEIETNINERKDIFLQILEKIDDNIRNREYYAARNHIREAELKGFKVDNYTVLKINNKISEFEKNIEQCKKVSEEEAVFILSQITEEVSDSTEVRKLLNKYPPRMPVQITFSGNETGFIIKWSESVSKGNISYVLIKKKGGMPAAYQDGEVIYEGKNTTFTDAKVQKNTLYYYAVYAVRLGIRSELNVLSRAAVLIGNVENIKIIGGDSLLSVSWKRTDTIYQVNTQICQADFKPSDNNYRLVDNDRIDGVTIRGLQNGKRYYIKITALHTIAGKNFESESVIRSAVPDKPIKPLENFHIKRIGESYIATWEKVSKDVILFQSDRNPSYTVGYVYDINDVLRNMEKVIMHLKSSEEAEIKLKFTGAKYIIPGVISGTNVVLSKPYKMANIPDAQNGYVEKTASGSLYINFKWARSIKSALILYRYDQYPEGPKDSQANFIICTKEQYDSNSGVEIEDPKVCSYFISIYMCYEENSEKIYSDGLKVAFDNKDKQELFYQLEYKKTFFSKKRSLFLTVYNSDNKKFIMPPFILVAKNAVVPLNKDDGYRVSEVKTETIVDGKHTFELECNELAPKTKVKLFFERDADYHRFLLKKAGSNSI